MTAKDLLGLIVRLFGLFLLICGIYGELYAALEAMGLTHLAQEKSAGVYFYVEGFYMIAGFIIVRKAGCIENFCYKSDKKSD